MRTGQARSVYKTLADHVIGRAALANVERLLKEADGVLHGLAVCRADAVTPVMALAQSLDLLFVEFHAYLVWRPSRFSCLSSLLYTALSEASGELGDLEARPIGVDPNAMRIY